MKVPAPLLWLWKGWMAFSHALGKVMSAILLTVFWLTVVALYAIILKIIRIPKLFATAPATYWVDSEPRIENDMRYPF
jgi:hypothetical protein